MQNHDNDNKYELLIEEACQALGLSYQELRNKYSDYPHCLMEYLEKEVHEHVIEVRLENDEATLSISFNKEHICDASFMFFDNLKDEDSFIEYLNGYTNYDFKHSCWMLANCYLRVKPSTKCETAFYFYK